MSGKPTVFVVDDDPGTLRSLCWLIRQADLPVQAFRSGREFLSSYHPQEPGCLVLDLRMPEMGGLDVQEHLRERGIGLPIIFLTAYGDVPTCSQAFKAGAFHFLEKPADAKILLAHIRTALARDDQQQRQRPESDFTAGLSHLTPREKEVLDMLISCKSLKDIASVTNVTVQTVWRHRLSIFKKLGVKNDAELVRIATRLAYGQHR